MQGLAKIVQSETEVRSVSGVLVRRMVAANEGELGAGICQTV